MKKLNIHHIWLQGGVPKQYVDNYNKWSVYNNKVWNEVELLELCTDEEREEYSKINTLINRVNYLKYILLYNKGGIFADLDSYPIKDIELLFEETSIRGIEHYHTMKDVYPFNTQIDEKKFGEYDIIIPAKSSLSSYSSDNRAYLLDNPVLISKREKNPFWKELIQYCKVRTDIKRSLVHEPYGPFGLTSFVQREFPQPYKSGICILPFQYLTGIDDRIEPTYIIHLENRGWG